MARYVPLVEQAEAFFAARRKLGFRPRTEREEVLHFARRVDQSRTHRITLETVVDWAKDSPHGSPEYIAHRYEAVRRFLTRISGTRPNTVIPPPGFLGARFSRRRVHIYSGQEIHDLMSAALELRPPSWLMGHTYSTLYGLLDATGLRIGEAIALDAEDVDFDEGTLLVRQDKGGRSRCLPLHATTVEALREYASRRDRHHPIPKSPAFFLKTKASSRLDYQKTNDTFRELRRNVGWTAKPLPRVHDLRHTFAVRKLLQWIREGKNIDVELPALTAYLGHATPESTYWYLTSVPELTSVMANHMQRLESARLGVRLH